MDKTLNKRLADIQLKLKAPKNQFNKFGNFSYRSCEDILEAIKPLLDDLTLFLFDEVVVIGDRYYVKATVTISDGANQVTAQAFAREADTKAGMDVAQITGSASSYARKYALNGLFLIDDTGDPDTQDNSVKGKVINNKEDVTKVLNGKLPDSPDQREVSKCEICDKPVDETVKAYSLRKYNNRVLCRVCQLKEMAK